MTENIDLKNSLAIIPARGGSKNIPLKNITPIAGKPLIAYTIEAARQSKYIQRVIVTTDHPRIAETAVDFGAEVVIRPQEISGDTASSEAAILHALSFLKQKEDYIPDLCVFLQCTSPLTLSKDIDLTLETLISEDSDTALAVTPFHYFLWRKNHTNNAVGINHDKSKRLLRQQSENQFLETGAIYVMKTNDFITSKHRFFGKTTMYIMPPDRCFEIDNPVDLKIAEVLIKEQIKQEVLYK